MLALIESVLAMNDFDTFALVSLALGLWGILRYTSILRHPKSLKRGSLLYWWWSITIRGWRYPVRDSDDKHKELTEREIRRLASGSLRASIVVTAFMILYLIFWVIQLISG
jgi:hypothetical protein